MLAQLQKQSSRTRPPQSSETAWDNDSGTPLANGHLLVPAARPRLRKPRPGAGCQDELWAAETSPIRAKKSPETGLQGPAGLGGNGRLPSP